MNKYKNAFVIALIGNVLLIAVLGGFWWRSRRESVRTQQARTEAIPVDSTEQARPGLPALGPGETPLAPVQLSSEKLQSIGVKFGVVVRKFVQDEIRTTGTVAIDETRVSSVQTRISGHIEKVFANATYQYVQEGQALFTMHSPELIAAEREYLLAKENVKELSGSNVPGVASGASSLLTSAKDRLAQWNIPEKEIARLEASGQASDALEVESPVSGYITERNALPNMMVQPDTKLYSITNLAVVWVFAQVFQNDLDRVRVGAGALLNLDSYPERSLKGRVDFIYPEVDPTTRTTRVRLVFANPKLTLKPGMYVNVQMQIALGVQTVIPASGVLQSGTRQIAFVDRGGGTLEPREIQLGPQAGNEYIVLKGLKPGERIVTSANFLVDSESQLQAALGSFVPSPPEAGSVAAVGGPGIKSNVPIEFTTSPSPAQKGANNFRVRLTAADGSPLQGAAVSVVSYLSAMPEMGMPAKKLVTPLRETGKGVYEARATLGSGGKWQIKITATKGGAVIAEKQLTLLAEGGM
jgi:RND family efflux transporter MFP subunit